MKNTPSKCSRIHILLNANGTVSMIDHMLGHKTSLSKFKIEITSNISFNYNGMKLEINYKKKAGKNQKYEKTKHHATEQLLGQGEVKREIKNT